MQKHYLEILKQLQYGKDVIFKNRDSSCYYKITPKNGEKNNGQFYIFRGRNIEEKFEEPEKIKTVGKRELLREIANLFEKGYRGWHVIC